MMSATGAEVPTVIALGHPSNDTAIAAATGASASDGSPLRGTPRDPGCGDVGRQHAAELDEVAGPLGSDRRRATSAAPSLRTRRRR